MSLRILVVDDEAPARRRIKKLLAKEPDLLLEGEAENGAQAISLINQLKPDLVLLDIQLKDMTGFDVLKSVDAEEVSYIFVTAYDEFAIRAFEDHAIDYLLKPYSDERFYQAIAHAKKILVHHAMGAIRSLLEELKTTDQKGKVLIPEGKTTHILAAENLIFIKAEGYYCTFYDHGQEKKMIRISLKKLTEILPDNFVRIGRSVIINKHKIEAVKEFTKTVEVRLTGGHEFSVDGKSTRLFD